MALAASIFGRMIRRTGVKLPEPSTKTVPGSALAPGISLAREDVAPARTTKYSPWNLAVTGKSRRSKPPTPLDAPVRA